MRRFQMMIDKELDEALERRARKERVSKAEVLRRIARRELVALPPIEEDPLWDLVGAGNPDAKGLDAEIDEVVYEWGRD